MTVSMRSFPLERDVNPVEVPMFSVARGVQVVPGIPSDFSPDWAPFLFVVADDAEIETVVTRFIVVETGVPIPSPSPGAEGTILMAQRHIGTFVRPDSSGGGLMHVFALWPGADRVRPS